MTKTTTPAGEATPLAAQKRRIADASAAMDHFRRELPSRLHAAVDTALEQVLNTTAAIYPGTEAPAPPLAADYAALREAAEDVRYFDTHQPWPPDSDKERHVAGGLAKHATTILALLAENERLTKNESERHRLVSGDAEFTEMLEHYRGYKTEKAARVAAESALRKSEERAERMRAAGLALAAVWKAVTPETRDLIREDVPELAGCIGDIATLTNEATK